MAGRTPTVSVVLPVYNAAGTVARALRSILDQTYDDLEAVVINDGSSDGSREILATFSDSRVRVIDQENSGLVAALNRGIGSACGRYIARMDADDVALPERFQRQVDFLDLHRQVAVLGCAARVVYADGRERIRRRPLDTAAIRRHIVRICPFFHSSVMIRRETFDRVGLYDPACDGSRGGERVEDYDLWVRMLAVGLEMANLPDALMIYYRTPNSIARRRSVIRRVRQQVRSRMDAIERLQLGIGAYANLVPVVTVSLLDGVGVRLDPLFNLLARPHRGRPRSALAGDRARRHVGHG